ncbi:MAG: hypothetical protein LQ349_004126 [Xanthoria aureola]|nr:MAG: hypothetical protein LQ349_004126 [Xanthoria aureola]
MCLGTHLQRFFIRNHSGRNVLLAIQNLPHILCHWDPHFKKAVAACDGTNPQKFQFDVCSRLVDCIYDNVTEAFKASMSSGTNIASLLPTILVLIGTFQCTCTQIFKYHWKQIRLLRLICLTGLIVRLPTAGARRTGFFITPSSNRSMLLWHWPS